MSNKTQNTEIGVIIISGSCCIPGMAPFDEQAKRVVEQAVSETDVKVQVKVIPASTAYFGAIPKDVMAKIITEFNQSGRMPLPAVLINGKVVSYGVPKVEDVKTALLQTLDTKEIKEDAK
ncbi:MAG: hypothetical protein OIN86_02910 [Candidatus Methanoperedens sp.]|nr:hypothetical protein [Candidatus Methanoperedens sp.]CAG0979945.1 hypothetical protein METP1_01715 [Methanosarcinales archaeon]